MTWVFTLVWKDQRNQWFCYSFAHPFTTWFPRRFHWEQYIILFVSWKTITSQRCHNMTLVQCLRKTRAAREARSFRQQRDTAQGPADPVTTWRVPLPAALKEALVIDLGLQWVSQNTLVLTILLDMRRAQPKPCKHLASTCLHMSWMPASKASYGHYPMKGWFAYLCHLGSECCLYWPTADDKKKKRERLAGTWRAFRSWGDLVVCRLTATRHDKLLLDPRTGTMSQSKS